MGVVLHLSSPPGLVRGLRSLRGSSAQPELIGQVPAPRTGVFAPPSGSDCRHPNPALAPAWAQLCRDGPHPGRGPLSLPPRRGMADSLTAQHRAPRSRTLGAGSRGAASGAPVKVSSW